MSHMSWQTPCVRYTTSTAVPSEDTACEKMQDDQQCNPNKGCHNIYMNTDYSGQHVKVGTVNWYNNIVRCLDRSGHAAEMTNCIMADARDLKQYWYV